MTPLEAAVARLVARCTKRGDCLLTPGDPAKYAEVTAPGMRMLAHRAVVIVRDGPIPDGRVVRHSCDTPGCIASDHLIVGTQAQNVNDEYTRGRRTEGWRRGDAHPSAVLTAETVRAMRRRARAGSSLQSVAAEFSVRYAVARGAIRGETWKHVTDEPPVPGRINARRNPARYTAARRGDALRAAELSLQGRSLAEIGEALGVSRNTAFTLRKPGVELQGARA